MTTGARQCTRAKAPSVAFPSPAPKMNVDATGDAACGVPRTTILGLRTTG